MDKKLLVRSFIPIVLAAVIQSSSRIGAIIREADDREMTDSPRAPLQTPPPVRGG
jgi:hypothetical protein